MKSNKWIRFGRILIIIFSFVLFINAYVLFVEIKRDINYHNRAYGLSYMDDSFNNGEYYQIYIDSIKNSISDEDPIIDTSQYEIFGRIFNNYINAKMYDDEKYMQEILNDKKLISWDKIKTVIDGLENDIKNK